MVISYLKGSRKPGHKNCAFRNKELSFVSAIERTSTLFPTMSQRFSNLLQIELVYAYMRKKYIYFLGFFDIKLPKWDTFEAIKEEAFVRLLIFSSIFLYNQPELTIFSKCFVKRALALLLTCNLLVFRQELFMLLLSIKRIP